MTTRAVAAVALVGCASRTPSATTPLRAACADGQFWAGKACAPVGDAKQKLAAGKEALAAQDLDKAKADLDAAAAAGPLDHDTNVTLWEQRGIADAYGDDEAGARSAFDMMLALDPSHLLSYTLSQKATYLFEKIRTEPRTPPAIDVTWPRGGKVGDAVPVDVDVVADPKQFLKRATLFVRTRGDKDWHAADVPLAKTNRVVLPPVTGTKPASLELYLRAYDDKNNEVLTWADPAQPREIALRYDPPTPWYRTGKGITGITLVGIVIASVVVYELTVAPPDKINGSAGLK